MAANMAFFAVVDLAEMTDPSFKTAVPTNSSLSTCWVFNHMNKASGSTVKHILSEWGNDYGTSVGLYSGKRWKLGTQYAQEYWDEGNAVTMGDYTETLRRVGAGHCKWFTVFRHPLPRLVSAYMYCRDPTVRDQLCGSLYVEASEVDIVTFAEHWSNYGMRQFVLSFMTAEVVMNSTLYQENPRCAVWYLVKDHLNQAHTNSTSTIDEGMLRFVEPVKDLISNNYTAIGILEELTTTSRLFNKALNLPRMDWEKEFQEHGSSNGMRSQFKAEKAKVMEQAQSDARVEKAMQLDLALYEHALKVHREQLIQYGLA